MTDEKAPLILIVDDDSAIRSLMKLAIQSKGYRLEEAANGEECLTKYLRCQPDLILLDAVMPEMDGFTCCERLRSLSDSVQTPILMLTFLDDRDSIDRAFAMGATDYLTKPIHWTVLFQRVQRLLSTSQALAKAETVAAQLAQQQAWENLIRSVIQQLSDRHVFWDVVPAILTQLREFFQLDRLVLYEKANRRLIESVALDYPPAEANFFDKLDVKAQKQAIAIDNLDLAEISSEAIELLRQLKTQAVLISPVINQEKLWGKLFAHHSKSDRTWTQLDKERFGDLANLLSLAIS